MEEGRDKNTTLTPWALFPPCCKQTPRMQFCLETPTEHLFQLGSCALRLPNALQAAAARIATGCTQRMDHSFCKAPVVPPDTPESENISSSTKTFY